MRILFIPTICGKMCKQFEKQDESGQKLYLQSGFSRIDLLLVGVFVTQTFYTRVKNVYFA